MGGIYSDFISLLISTLCTCISNQMLIDTPVCNSVQALSSKLFEPSVVVSNRRKILDNAHELSDGSFCRNKRFLFFQAFIRSRHKLLINCVF